MSTIYGEGFSLIPEGLLDDGAVSDRAFRLYAMLARYADNDGRSFPGRRRLADRLGCALSTLDVALKELCDAGYLETAPRYRSDGGRTSNDYYVRWGAGHPLAVGSGPGRLPLDEAPPADTSGDRPTDPPGEVAAPIGQQERESDNDTQMNESQSSTAPPPATTDRARNHAWDALVAALGWEPSTKAEKTRVGRAVREITSALPEGTSPEDVGKHITARAGRYRAAWPDAELTPESLVKHWARFAPGKASGGARGAPPRKRYEDMTDEEFAAARSGMSPGELTEALDARRRATVAREP